MSVRVQPGASRDQVTLRADGSLEVRLRARPVEGKANEALLALLAETLHLRRREVILVRGERSRSKIVEVPLTSLEEVGRRIG